MEKKSNTKEEREGRVKQKRHQTYRKEITEWEI